MSGQRFREAGNAHFRKGDLQAALQEYTRGIQHQQDDVKLFTNRALVFLRLNNYQSALDDAVRATELDNTNAKAYYQKGQALRALGERDRAISAMKRGYELAAQDRTSTLFDDLFQSYFTMLRLRHEEDSARRHEGLRATVDECKSTIGATMSRLTADESRQAQNSLGVLEQIFASVSRRAEDESPFQAMPDCYVCPIALTVMRDPVIMAVDKDGVSYERSSLVQHFRERGPLHPITLERLPVAALSAQPVLVPNVALRNAIETFLITHPWLYRD